MQKLAIQTNLSLILFLGHCCWRLRSFNSFAQFLDTAGKVVNKYIYLECLQIKNYLTIFDRYPFNFWLFDSGGQGSRGEDPKTGFSHWSASCKIRFFLLFLCSEDLLFQISCAPKRFIVQYLLNTNAKGSFVPNLSQISQPVWSMRGVLGGLLGSRSSLPPGCAMCICVLIEYHPFDLLSSASHRKSFAELGDSRTKQPKRSIKEVFKKRSV